MALNNLGLGFVFTARDLASGTISRVGGAFGTMDRNAMRASASYGRNFAVMGAGLAIMGAGAATLAGAFSLAESAATFEQGLARVGAIARATSDDMVLLRQAAIDAGIATQFSPTEAVEGLNVLAQQGFNTANSIRLLRPALDLAAGGSISIEQAAESMTAAVHVFGLDMDQAGLAADQMLRITNATALAAGDMSLAIGTVARGARLTQQSIQEMLPSVGLLRNTGVDVSVAAQSVSSALTFMASRADKIQESLGVNLVETLADGTQRFRPFMDIAQEAGVALEERFANPAERTAKAVELFGRFGVGAVTGVFSALSAGVTDSEGRVYQGAAAIEYLRGQMTGASGAAAEFRERLLDTFAGQQVLLQGSLQTLGVVVGEGFTRGLRPFVELTIDLVNRAIAVFNEIPVEVRGAMASVTLALGGLTFAFGAIVATGAALALIAPFIEAIATAIGGLLAAMAPFALVAVAIFGVVYAFQRLVAANDRFAAGLRRGVEVVRLAFRGLVQLFTTGELSGAIAEELTRAENAGILKFIVDIYAIGFRLMQFFRGIGAGFEAGLGTLGPSVERMVAAFSALGDTLGFVGGKGKEAVAGMPSEKFINTGARIGAFLAGVIEMMVEGITRIATFLTEAAQGWDEFFKSAAPALALLGPAVEFLGEQLGGLIEDLGMAGEGGKKGTSSFKSFGHVVGWVAAGAVNLLVSALDVAIGVTAAVIGGVRALVQIVESLPRVFAWVGLSIQAFFLNVLDDFSSLVDQMIIGYATLAGMVPPGLRPAGLNSLIASGDEAQGRVDGRTAARAGRDRIVGGAFDAAFPAGVEASARGKSDARSDAALGAVARILQVQAKERNQQPWNVSLVVDGERLARATGNGKNRDTAAAFGLTTAED